MVEEHRRGISLPLHHDVPSVPIAELVLAESKLQGDTNYNNPTLFVTDDDQLHVIWSVIPWDYATVTDIRYETPEFPGLHTTPSSHASSASCLTTVIQSFDTKSTRISLRGVKITSNGLVFYPCHSNSNCEPRVVAIASYQYKIRGERYQFHFALVIGANRPRLISVSKPLLFPTLEVTFDMTVNSLSPVDGSKVHSDSSIIMSMDLHDKGGLVYTTIADLLASQQECSRW
jgi:hypothetical protein